MPYRNKIMTALGGAALLTALVAPHARGAEPGPVGQATTPPTGSVTESPESPYVEMDCTVSGDEFVAKNTAGLPTIMNTVVHFTNGKGGDAFTFTAKEPIGGHGVVKAKPPHPAAGCKAKFERGKTDLRPEGTGGWLTSQGTKAQILVYTYNNFVKPKPFVVRFRASAGCKPSSDDVVIDSAPVDIPAGNQRIASVEFPDTKRRMLTMEIDATNVVPELDEGNNKVHSPEWYTACK